MLNISTLTNGNTEKIIDEATIPEKDSDVALDADSITSESTLVPLQSSTSSHFRVSIGCKDKRNEQYLHPFTGKPIRLELERGTSYCLSQCEPVKLVLVGNAGVGKTTLCINFTTMTTLPVIYTPKVFDGYSATYMLEDKPVCLGIWDTSTWNPDEERDKRLRPLAYPHTSVFVICFGLNDRESFRDVETKYYPEISHHCPNVPFVVVGCKSDLRKETLDYMSRNSTIAADDSICFQEGWELARRIGAEKYIECTAHSLESVNVAFSWAVLVAVNHIQAEAEKKFMNKNRRFGAKCIII